MRLIASAVLVSVLALVGCNVGDMRSMLPGNTVIPAEASPYQLLIGSSDLSPGRSRLVLTLWDGPERAKGMKALEMELLSLNDDGQMNETLWEGKAKKYQMGETQYWVLYPEFPEPGNYGVRTIVTIPDGQRVENRALLRVKEAPEAPAIGDPAPRSETRTLEDAPVEALTSAGPYVDRFYEMSVAEAAESGKVSIIGFATPAYCMSKLCGPVMETLQVAGEEMGDSVNIVHVEIYRDFAANEVDPAVDEWNLPSEPWIFVLDERGNIAARLDGLVGPDELREVVDKIRTGRVNQ